MRLSTAAAGRCIGEKLHMTSLVKQIEPRDCFFDRLSDCQQPVVSKQRRFILAECLSDIAALIFIEDDALAVKYDVIL